MNQVYDHPFCWNLNITATIINLHKHIISMNEVIFPTAKVSAFRIRYMLLLHCILFLESGQLEYTYPYYEWCYCLNRTVKQKIDNK